MGVKRIIRLSVVIVRKMRTIQYSRSSDLDGFGANLPRRDYWMPRLKQPEAGHDN